MFKVSQDIHAAPIVLTRCRKLYCLGRRVHHGLTGELLIAAGLAFHRRYLTAMGAALVLHDHRDFPFPLKDPEGWGPKQLNPGGSK